MRPDLGMGIVPKDSRSIASLLSAALPAALALGMALAAPATATLQARLVVYPEVRLGAFNGFGGNFCFDLDDGVAQVVRERLDPPVARVRMHLDDLRESSPVSSDRHADWMRTLREADLPRSELWQCLEVAAALHQRRTCIHISTWRVPAWLLDKPIQHDQNVIPPDHIKEFAGMIAAYLDYLRQSRGVEPATFSFNEPDWGANVIFTPEGHRDALLEVAAEMRQRGLRTRLMLGDLSNARDGTDFLTPVLDTPELMELAAGISFHAWGEASHREYAVWRRLADRLGLPLVIGEIGVDYDWRNVQLHGYSYAIEELKHYFNVLKAARPQSILYWEYGASYALLPPYVSPTRLANSERLSFQQHWVWLTPPESEAIACYSSRSEIMAAVFAIPRERGEGLTLHIGNFGDNTSLEIYGLPHGLRILHVYTTSQGSYCRRSQPLMLKSGRGRITLPARSLATLTSIEEL